MDDPLILTLKMDDASSRYFDTLRKQHFPAERNYIDAHLTLFHRLPGEAIAEIVTVLGSVVAQQKPILMTVNGLRLLGAGVAYRMDASGLQSLRGQLFDKFKHWLGAQDKAKFSPHVTIQNKVTAQTACALHVELSASFRPFDVTAIGLDLWHYRGGPWQPAGCFAFKQ